MDQNMRVLINDKTWGLVGRSISLRSVLLGPILDFLVSSCLPLFPGCHDMEWAVLLCHALPTTMDGHPWNFEPYETFCLWAASVASLVTMKKAIKIGSNLPSRSLGGVRVTCTEQELTKYWKKACGQTWEWWKRHTLACPSLPVQDPMAAASSPMLPSPVSHFHEHSHENPPGLWSHSPTEWRVMTHLTLVHPQYLI